MTVRQALKGQNEDNIVLLSFVLNKDKAWIFANPDFKLSPQQTAKYKRLTQKRAKYWPVAYLTGHKEFYGLDFSVSPSVLIPRPETELLVEFALSAIRDKRLKIKNVIDIGTGSGAIIISLAKSLQNRRIKFFATDISKSALQVARVNARNHKLAKKIIFYKGDLLSPLLKSYIVNLKSSLILANLPYVPRRYLDRSPKKKISTLGNDDFRGLRFEPRIALTDGTNEWKIYEKFFQQAKKILKTNSAIYLEIDPDSKALITKWVKKYFPNSTCKFHRDLSGRWRVVEIIVD